MSWTRKHIVEEFGESWETSNSHVICGSILVLKWTETNSIRDDVALDESSRNTRTVTAGISIPGDHVEVQKK